MASYFQVRGLVTYLHLCCPSCREVTYSWASDSGTEIDPLLNLVSPLGCEVDAQEEDSERDSKRRRLV